MSRRAAHIASDALCADRGTMTAHSAAVTTAPHAHFFVLISSSAYLTIIKSPLLQSFTEVPEMTTLHFSGRVAVAKDPVKPPVEVPSV